ncbi:MAG: hypothetical protein ACPGTU_09660 [Myxococcota bacterium]
MRDALTVLQRIRHHKKKGAELAFVEAERAREKQESRVDSIEKAVEDSREKAQVEDEACWVAQAASWRMKMEVRLRQERSLLNERSAVVDDRQKELAHASKESRVVERIIEINDERRAIERRRKEGRRLDAMGTARWNRKGAK